MSFLFDHIARHVRNGERVALCTLVDARGSTPQETGAKMLVLQSGQILGTLGGGCVEAEVRRRALELLLAGKSDLLTFRLDHDYGWDDGLICGGTMDVFVHSLTQPADADPFAAMAAAIAARQPTAFRFPYTSPEGPQLYDEPLAPAPILLIAGAGHVGQALAPLAADLDFSVAILDDRPDFANATRFPRATQHIVGDIETELARFPIDPHTYIVIVTRGHRHDGQALAAVIRSPAPYVGLIGSRRKILTILTDLAQQGIPESLLAAVHAPIGYNIGAVTVPEIAISIAAELIAVRRQKPRAPAPLMQLDPTLLHTTLQKLRQENKLPPANSAPSPSVP